MKRNICLALLTAASCFPGAAYAQGPGQHTQNVNVVNTPNVMVVNTPAVNLAISTQKIFEKPFS